MRTSICIILVLAAGMLAACQSNAPGKPKPQPVGPVTSALQSGHWKRIQTKPPTYFPTETPADQSTDYRDGFWVDAGDSQGTRFFIPAHGTQLSQEHLIAEAHAAMSPAAKKELERQGRRFVAGDITGKTIGGVTRMLGAAASAMGNMGSSSPEPATKSKKQPTPEQQPKEPSPSTPASNE